MTKIGDMDGKFLNSLVVLGNRTRRNHAEINLVTNVLNPLNLSNMQWLPSINMKLLLLRQVTLL